MGFNPPVPQNDSDWEIRVAVLLSLLLQILLIFVGPMRKRTSHPFPRFLVWACYLLADWVADLALGLMLNNMGNIGGGGGGNNSSSSSFGSNKRGGGGGGNNVGSPPGNNGNGGSPMIFAFWTPFLLLHLGGPDTITAYSLEDNELWLRHLIGLLFELFSALVIFGCSVHTNPMAPATVLMFVVGIVKYGERTYSLYSGSVDGFRDKILDEPDPGPNYAKLMTEFDAKRNAGLVVEVAIADGEASEAQRAAEEKVTQRLVVRSRRSVEARAYGFFLTFRRLFVNLILSFKERRQSQAFFVEKEELRPSEAFEVIEVELNFIYDMVYTKAPVAHAVVRRWVPVGWLLRTLCSCCLVASLVVFFLLPKRAHGIRHVDVAITYALLLGGLALDFAALLMLLFSNRVTVYLETHRRLRWVAQATKSVARRFWRTRRWSGKTSQMSLVSYALGKPDRLNRVARCCLCLVRCVGRCCPCLRFVGKLELVDDLVFISREPIVEPERGGTWIQRLVRRLTFSRGKADREPPLLEFIFRGLKRAAKKLKEKHEIMSLCNCRGNFVIDHHKDAIKDALRKHKRKEYADAIKKSPPTPAADQDDINNKDAAAAAPKNPPPPPPEDAPKNPPSEDEINKEVEEKFQLLKESVGLKDFDESLLLWHIATDLCRSREVQLKGSPEWVTITDAPTEKTTRMRGIGETLSEYMLYLLIKQPEMLSATAGIGLIRYRDTCAEAKRFFASMAAWDPGHGDARRMLLGVNTSKKPAEVKGDRSKSVLFDAVILAKALRELGDEEFMWTLIAKVWREMLTFAAGKCRGSTHVRQLSRGGELITLVWFLMAHMGLGDMYQIQAGDAKAKLIVIDQ